MGPTIKSSWRRDAASNIIIEAARGRAADIACRRRGHCRSGHHRNKVGLLPHLSSERSRVGEVQAQEILNGR